MKNLIAKTKKTIKANSNKIWLAGTGAVAIGTAYLYGKTNGATTIEVYLTTVAKDENIITQELPEVK